ncbi:MAG: hypothetical protein IJ433_02045 [Ruminococcus sp.]|nr:hypothetical protein [Ruminococcus sp.]
MKHIKENSEKSKYSKRTDEQRAATRKLTSRIFIGVSVALVLIFIVFIFVTTNFMGSDSIVTETAFKTTVSDTISTSGFVIRDISYIDNVSSGVLAYQVTDGDKVTAKGTIATIYQNESDAVNFQRICEIDDEIEELKTLNNISHSVNVGLDSVNNQLDNRLSAFVESINKRDFNSISSIENDLISAIYRKQIITGDQMNFDDNIAQLEEEKAQLQSVTGNSIGEIIAEDSGYFTSAIDGYENLFSIDDLKEITYSDIKDAKPANIDEGKYVGKIIKGVNWYLACPVTAEQAVAITHNSSNVSVRIPYASADLIPAKVKNVNQFSGEEMAIVVLECNYMSPALSHIRNESVDIELNTYEGLKVSKKALHDDYVTKITFDENGNKITEEVKVQGVYVKYGRQLIFKQVFILYSDEDYVICSDKPDNETLITGYTLELYDEVVVEGDDLYNGKLID